MPLARFLRLFGLLLAFLSAGLPAEALEAVRVQANVPVIDLAPALERPKAQGGTVELQTAPGADGIVRRIVVKAREGSEPADWIAFALSNDSDEVIERLLVVPHFRLVGSGVLTPDLGSSRVSAITVSQGEAPTREENPEADAFLISLDPKSTVTFVAELRTTELPQIYLWDPDAYKEKQNGLTLYRGIIIGVSALLALFLTVVFVVKGALIFPAAAALAWSVLAYAAIDFGFLSRIFGLPVEAVGVYRSAAEAVLAATLLVFLFAYLNLNRWSIRYIHVTIVWLVFLAGLVALAIVNPPFAAGVARLSIGAIAGIGLLLVLFLAINGFERAVMLIPTWVMLSAWVVVAGFTVSGDIANELAAPALIGGLVLIVMLIGFTIVQHAFAGDASHEDFIPDANRRALALVGSGDAVFDWDVGSDRIHASAEIETQLGLKAGSLNSSVADWLEAIHPFDRDRFRGVLDAILERRRGRVVLDMRIKSSGGQYYWYQLKARPVIGANGEVSQVVGTLSDVTEQRTQEERLLRDAVHDNLTGLPNRTLFQDRLTAAIALSKQDPAIAPAVLAIDVDRFKNVNESVGLSAGDSILLTLSRRIGRLLRAQDTLARVAGDQFAAIILSERDPEAIAELADLIRRAIGTPITLGEREIFLTASVGIALFDPAKPISAEDAHRNAELAMVHAKRLGGDRIVEFRPAMRISRSDKLGIEADLRQALQREELKIFFQPIVRLQDRTIAGFEALLRWNHPRLGRLQPKDFIAIAEESSLIVNIGIYVLERTARELAAWQQAIDVDPPIFASVNISSRQLIRHDLLHDVKAALAKYPVIKGTLKLELTESLVMENPEYAAQMLTRIRDLGAGLSLDDFGTGYSSLSYLERFPFDTIKIDKNFVRENKRGMRSALLRPIISIGHDLGMSVIAEGAEDETDAVELYQLGCDYAQGFLFGEAMPAAEARRLVGAAPDTIAAA